MEGFTGYLSTRFFTSEREWRHTGFSISRPLTCRGEVRVLEEDGQSYALSANDAGALTLSDLEGNPLPYLDTLGVQEHFLRFKKVHLETYRSRLAPEVEDSLRNASAAFELTAIGKDGRREDIHLHWKPRTGLDRDAEGNLMDHDGEQMYGVTSEGEVVMVH